MIESSYDCRREAAIFPASFGQQRLWFLEQLEPGTPLYNVPVRLWLEGGFDAAVVERCLSEIVRRHEVLRTTFEMRGDGLMQVVRPPEAFPLRLADFSASRDPEQQAGRAAAEEFESPFDLADGPPVRGLFARVGPMRGLLSLTFHHIVFDGWSLGVLVREFAVLYESFAAGRPSPLPELELQYADFAQWQKEWLCAEALDQQLAYWREALNGAGSKLALPVRGTRQEGTRRGGERTARKFNRAAVSALRGLSRQEMATAYMILLAGFYALLHRYTGECDIVVGSPASGRTRPEIEGLIGFFVNTLALRVELSGELSFRDLLRRVRHLALDAFANQDVPFERVVEDVRPARASGRNPLFDVMFTYQGAPPKAIRIPGLTITAPPVLAEEAKFDLMLEVTDGTEIEAALVYDAAMFDVDDAARMLEHFETLLAAAVVDPDRRIAELPLMSAAEREQVLIECNRTATPYPQRSIQELFEEQAANTPDAIALDFEGRLLTYAELNRRANRVAHWLRARSVGPDTLVALCAERSLDMIAGMLGIVKAGGAYVPLDPNYPAQRLAFMLEDTRTAVVLTQTRSRHLFSAGTRVLCLEDADLAEFSDENPPVTAGLDNPAYLIYTSGSTGQPKAALIPQRGVVRLVKEAGYCRLGPGEVMLQFAPISFDASTFEIWGALLNGARLVVFPPYTPSLEELGGVIRRKGITTLWLTAGLFHQMIEREAASLTGLRQLLAGGDALSAAHVREALRRLPGCRLINGYGPTENTTFTCCADLSAEAEIGAAVPIGRPIANTRVYVLDARGEPVPVGVPGELYIGGDGLACGYWQRPELTAERFVASALDPGGRLYRTGDLARWRADGQLEFLGRLDQQVKVRGFRVELAEIEAALGTCAGVRQAAVAARAHVAGGKRLVAYVVGDATPAPLRAQLRERLPDYMVPSVFVSLPELPLNANGKVDRGALPDPEPSGMDEVHRPASPLEDQLARIYSDLLGIERAGPEDDFFLLGGHSLLGTQLISRVRDVFRVELPLRTLFEAPTVEGLAARIEAARQNAAHAVPPIARACRDRALPLSFAQQRLWFLDRMRPGLAAYHVPVRIEFTGSLDVPALERALREIVRRHEALRTSFPSGDGQPYQHISPHVEFKLCDAPEALEQPFDLSTGPLVRAALERVAPDRHRLLLTFHHVVFDGWSLGVLAREIAALYRGDAMPELPVQYADYAVWQRGHMEREKLEQHLAYWRERLAAMSPATEVPTDRPRPPVQTFHGGTRAVRLSAQLSHDVAALSRREGATLFMTLLAAFQALLHRYTGQLDIVVGSPVAGRTRAEIEPLIGCFVNTLTLRTDLSGDPSFRELLARVREVTLGAYAHQDLPFERLVEELRPERRLTHTPLFQVAFAVQGAVNDVLELPGVAMRVLPLVSETAKFDLTMEIAEGQPLEAAINYNADLFHAGTIDRMLGHFETLLSAAVADPERPVSDLPLLTAREHNELKAWNHTAAEYPRERVIQELVEEHAARAPEALAVACGSTRLTYGELNRRANQLAHCLRARGVTAETPVAVCLERSDEMVIAVLAIVKAGGAYVPLDPLYPEARLRYLIEDSGAPVLIDRSYFDQPLTAYSNANPRRVTTAESLVYIVYTSGSTGQPKGVAVEQRGLMNLVTWHQREYRVTPRDRATQVASPAFDAMGWEIWPYLASGASIHIPDAETRSRPERLARWLADEGVTLTFLPTPLAEALLESAPSEDLKLRALLTGGDRLHRGWSGLGFRLMNHYGPTESSVVATWCEVGGDAESPPIGRPIANTRVYVLDGCGHPLPVGVPGELWIGGDGLARGYWRRPELTAERFVASTLDPVGRLYRTGDLVRWRPDGLLEFLGRVDQQVKIRGFRMELGEIEAALAACAGVREAVVSLRDNRLVAHYTGDAGAAALRGELGRTLPEYMVPSGFVRLDALPLTPNGKVDRDALPAAPVSTPSALPHTEIEQRIAAIWREALGVAELGVDENFMDLGGHSLLIAKVHSRLEQSFGREFPLLEFFRHPTISALAAFLGDGQTNGNGLQATCDRAARGRQALERIRQARITAAAGTRGAEPRRL